MLCTFRKASSFIRVDVEMQQLPAYFGNHSWGGEMMRNCPTLEKSSRTHTYFTKHFQGSLLINQTFKRHPHPTPPLSLLNIRAVTVLHLVKLFFTFLLKILPTHFEICIIIFEHLFYHNFFFYQSD